MTHEGNEPLKWNIKKRYDQSQETSSLGTLGELMRAADPGWLSALLKGKQP